MNVTIVIPTYKPHDYLWQCLDSFRNQTFDKSLYEIILVLNGPQDPYKSKINEYLAKHMFGVNVNFIATEAAGVSNARNLGIDAARGEYIGFVDDDDFVSPGYIEELYRNAAPDVIPVAYAISFFDEKPDVLIPYRKTLCYDARHKYGKQSVNPVSTYFSGPVYKLIHRDIIGARRFDTSFANGEDTIFNFEISDRFKYVVLTSKNATYYWRRRKGSSQSNLAKFSARWNRAIKMILKFNAIYIPNFWKYNFIFYLTRILSTVKSLFIKH